MRGELSLNADAYALLLANGIEPRDMGEWTITRPDGTTIKSNAERVEHDMMLEFIAG